ncbi:MAG: tetratricopeptide repeat protein, partial [Simkania sp.]|nr:tetratricopeptide repeat protein [Simkania sp.]
MDWDLFSSKEIELVDIELIVAKVHDVFSRSRAKKSLIIFDNAPKSFVSKALQGNLPRNTDILVTSVSTDWPSVETVNLVSDGECQMTCDERMEILTRWVSNPRLFDFKEAKKIVNRFELSPVVIAQAGRYISHTKTPMIQYLEIFDKKLEEVLAQGAIDDPKGPGEIDLFVSLKIPLEEIIKRSHINKNAAQALTLLQHIVQLPNKNIPRSLIRKVLIIDNLKLNPLLEMLDFLLITDIDHISIHDLFQRIVFEILRQNAYSPEAYSQNVKQTLSRLARVADEYIEFLSGDSQKAVEIYTQGIEDENSMQHPNAERVINLNLLNGDALSTLERYTDAEKFYQNACKACESHSISGGLYDQSRMKQGFVLGELSRFSDALPILEAVITDMETACNNRTEEYAKVQTRRGWTLERLGQYRKAIEIHEQTLLLRKTLFSSNSYSLEIADSQHWLGWALERIGQYGAAKDLLEEAYNRKKSCLGENHLAALHAEHDYAMLLGRLGDYEIAINLLKHVKKQRKKTLGIDHSKYADCIHNLAIVLAKSGDEGKARKLFEKSLEIKKKAFPRGHPSIVASLHGLANVSDLRASISMHRAALAQRIRLQGVEHPYIAYSKYDLACSLSKTNDPQDLDEAERLHKEALKKREDTFRDYPDHPWIADSK